MTDEISCGSSSCVRPIQEFPTLESLVQDVEQLFDCRDGHYGSHADGNSPEGLSIADAKADQDRRDPYRYRVLAAIIADKTPQELRQALYQDFLNLLMTCLTQFGGEGKKPVLYWRYASPERIHEEEQRASFGREHLWKIRTRIAIPEADWSVCEYLKLENEPSKRI